MRFGINLRGDLAKLDLSEIEERIECLFAERETVAASTENAGFGSRSLYQSGFALPFGRGPFHASLFYKLRALLSEGSIQRGVRRLHVIDCKLKDLVDELQRRHR